MLCYGKVGAGRDPPLIYVARFMTLQRTGRFMNKIWRIVECHCERSEAISYNSDCHAFQARNDKGGRIAMTCGRSALSKVDGTVVIDLFDLFDGEGVVVDADVIELARK